LRTRYGPPYRVSWTERTTPEGALEVEGVFELVPGFSVDHTTVWCVYSIEVQE